MESSTSASSHSESNSDEKVDHSQSLEVNSKLSIQNLEVDDSFKNLTEKLSAALVNVGAKEDLVKQHAKVAEEAVAGWEKAENEAATLRQQLEAAVQQNLALDVKTSHLDAALKECVKQLRILKEEQEQRANELLEQKTHKCELTKKNLEIQICNLEKENLTLKFDLNLSTQAAETASKQQLESIKKVTKLEAECRKLQLLTRKWSSINDNNKAVSVSSFYVDSLTESQSVDSFKVNSFDHNEVETEQGCADSWARALIAELDHFKDGKCVTKNVISCFKINNMMDDFLEMERIASLTDSQIETERCNYETELEEELEAEKRELENALNSIKESLAFSNAELAETKSQMVDLQKELIEVNKSKELLESRLVRMESEARIMSAEVDSIKADVEKERLFSSEMKVKCDGLEKELVEKTEEIRLQMAVNSNVEIKVKKGFEVAAADRLSECQKTISSLASQLESLATIEDFLTDTTNLTGFSGSFVSKTGGELWKLHSNDTFMPKKILMPAKQAENNCGLVLNGDDDESQSSCSSSSSSAVLLNQFGGRFGSKNGSRNIRCYRTFEFK